MTNTTETPLTLAAAQDFLRAQSARIAVDPMTNSVFALAQTLFQDIEAGRTSISELSRFAGDLHLTLISERADRFREQHYDADAKAAWTDVRGMLEVLAAEGFDAFKASIEQNTGGIVFTAHPTFALSRALRQAFTAHVTRPNKSTRAALLKHIREDGREWNKGINLNGEHDEVQDALLNAAGAQQVSYAPSCRRWRAGSAMTLTAGPTFTGRNR